MLRYKINILLEMKNAGYNTTRIRHEKILAESTLQRLRSGNTSINLDNLGVVCGILHCQPGDLVEWISAEDGV